jgi:hypothetical protein
LLSCSDRDSNGRACPGFAGEGASDSTITEGYASKYNTLAHAILNNEAAPSAVTQDMYRFVDSVIDEAQARIVKKAKYTRDEAVQALRVIDDVLIGKNVVYPADTAGMGLVSQLSDGLRGRIMNGLEIQKLAENRHNKRRSARIREHTSEPMYVNDCDTTSFLYLAIAEVIGLPLSLVEIPGHNFIRYNDGTNSFDWETMDAVVAPPDYYKTLWRISDDLIAKRVYLAAMSRTDVIGYHFTITAEVWAKKGVDRRVFDDDIKAATLYPHGPRVWNQLAWHLVTASDPKLRDGRAALEYATRAVSISRTPNLLDTLACAQAEVGNFERAKEIEEEARQLFSAGDYPVEVEVPAFDVQIRRFEQRMTCGETLPPSVAAAAGNTANSLSHVVRLD